MWREIDAFEMFDMLKEAGKKKSKDESPYAMKTTSVKKGICLFRLPMSLAEYEKILEPITIEANPKFEFKILNGFVCVEKIEKTIGPVDNHAIGLFENKGTMDNVKAFTQKVYDKIAELPDSYFVIILEVKKVKDRNENTVNAFRWAAHGQYIGFAKRENLYLDSEPHIEKAFTYHVIKVKAPEPVFEEEERESQS